MTSEASHNDWLIAYPEVANTAFPNKKKHKTGGGGRYCEILD